MLDSILESLRVVSLPTKTDFRSVTDREVALFEGPYGWGEFAPFLEYSPLESVPWLVSGIESAYVSHATPIVDRIAVNATLPAVNGEAQIRDVLSWFPGCNTIKIKVGANLQEDVARIAIARNVRPTAKIRIDVNGGWTVQQAITSLRAMYENSGEFEYVEQPCASLDELRELKRKIGFPLTIVGDEIVRKNPNPLAVDLRGAVDVVMLKVAPLGGISQSKRIATRHGLPVVVSSALDSAIGISAGLRLAGSFDSLPFAAGLGTGSLLESDVAHLPIEDGRMKVVDVAPTEEALEKFSVAATKYDFWRERISQTWAAGGREWIEREGWVA